MNGKKTGFQVGYHYNGLLEYKSSFENEKYGVWKYYSLNKKK